MASIMNYDDLVAQVRNACNREKRASKQGDTVSDATDPNLKGGATPPTSESQGGQESKRENPKSIPNSNNSEGANTLENKNAETFGSGEGPTKPATDPSGLPTGDLFSKQAKDITEAIKELMSAGQAKQATEGSDKPEGEVAKQAKTEATPEDIASQFEAEFSSDFHRKLASAITATEEGREYARTLLSKSYGVEAVDRLISNVERIEKQAAAQAQAAEQFNAFMNSMQPEERDEFIKSANFHYSEVIKYKHDFEKAAYEQGAMDAGLMLADEAEAMPPLPEEGAPPTIEEIILILDQLVQSGELAPELADAILMELTGGGVPGGEVLPPEAAGPITPEEAAVMAEMGKVASTADEVLAEFEKEDAQSK